MSEVKQRTLEELESIAAEKGVVFFLPLENELFLDIDASNWHPVKDIEELVDEHYGIERMLKTTSPGGQVHIYLQLKQTISTEERLILQLSLGSDPRKELISLIRIKEETDPFITLFETPSEALKVTEWRREGA
jgi:hypothetical protein